MSDKADTVVVREDDEEHAAAAKLQAVQRGNTIRKAANDQWIQYHLDKGEWEEAMELGYPPDQLLEIPKYIQEFYEKVSDDQVKALTKVQARAKGKNQRSEENKKKIQKYLDNKEWEKAVDLGYDYQLLKDIPEFKEQMEKQTENEAAEYMQATYKGYLARKTAKTQWIEHHLARHEYDEAKEIGWDGELPEAFTDGWQVYEYNGEMLIDTGAPREEGEEPTWDKLGTFSTVVISFNTEQKKVKVVDVKYAGTESKWVTENEKNSYVRQGLADFDLSWDIDTGKLTTSNTTFLCSNVQMDKDGWSGQVEGSPATLSFRTCGLVPPKEGQSTLMKITLTGKMMKDLAVSDEVQEVLKKDKSSVSLGEGFKLDFSSMMPAGPDLGKMTESLTPRSLMKFLGMGGTSPEEQFAEYQNCNDEQVEAITTMQAAHRAKRAREEVKKHKLKLAVYRVVARTERNAAVRVQLRFKEKLEARRLATLQLQEAAAAEENQAAAKMQARVKGGKAREETAMMAAQKKDELTKIGKSLKTKGLVLDKKVEGKGAKNKYHKRFFMLKGDGDSEELIWYTDKSMKKQRDAIPLGSIEGIKVTATDDGQDRLTIMSPRGKNGEGKELTVKMSHGECENWKVFLNSKKKAHDNYVDPLTPRGSKTPRTPRA